MDLRFILVQAGALLLGLAAVSLVNRAAPGILDRLGFTVPGESTTLTNADLAAYLAMSFVAGFTGALVIGLASRPLHLAPVLAYLAIGLALDGLAILNTLAGFPCWFRIAFIGTLPLQVWLGVLLGSRAI